MFLCQHYIVRTTIDFPDSLFRRAKVVAAVRGSSMRELIIRALEREVNAEDSPRSTSGPKQTRFPVINLKSGRKLDLSNFDFDDLLA